MGLAQSEVRCFMDGKCLLWDRTWPAGSLRELEALLWVSRVCSERCHCLISLSWAFYQQAQKQKFQDIFMYKYQPSSCPHRPKSESQTSAHNLPTPPYPTDVYCHFLSCFVPKYPTCTGAGPLKHPTNAATALSSCSLLQVFDRQTDRAASLDRPGVWSDAIIPDLSKP